MNKIFAVIMFVLSITGLSGVAMAQEVTLTVK
jgi:hypothetical protein